MSFIIRITARKKAPALKLYKYDTNAGPRVAGSSHLRVRDRRGRRCGGRAAEHF
jgi:hypothetical protein